MMARFRPMYGMEFAAVLLCVWRASPSPQQPAGSPSAAMPDSSGSIATVGASAVGLTGAFAESFGPGGRACGTCHRAGAGWSITPQIASAEFRVGSTVDPLFSPIDGTNSPVMDRFSTAARRAASSLLLEKGLIRMQRAVPAGADFALLSVDDPWHYASSQALSLYRRPLPLANLAFETTLMWDGRESPGRFRALGPALAKQARDAVHDHSGAAQPPAAAQVQRIVEFERGLYAAQSVSAAAGPLDAAGAHGGPVFLAQLAAHADGGRKPGGFDLFAAWLSLAGGDAVSAARRSIARGEVIFNTRRFSILGVAGYRGPARGTCASCHDTPDVGTSLEGALMDVGISSAALRSPDLPLYTFRSLRGAAQIATTDPGQALSTGRWREMNCFKVPGLRGLAARAPYFHNGCAAGIPDAVTLLNRRFTIGLSAREEADLCAFLAAL